MSKKTFKTVNPYTEESKEFTYNSLEDVKKMITKADDVFHKTWKTQKVQERSEYLAKTAELMKSRKTGLAKLAVQEMGKPLGQSEAEVDYCIQILEYYSQHALTYLEDKELPGVEHGEAYLKYQPLGVILSVQPWNFPFSQLIRFAAPNIVAGNTVIMKPAAITYECALAIQQLFDEAGLPEGVYNTFIIDTDEMEEIVSDERVKGVMLTGSEGAGASIAELAGKHLKKSVLELGGSDPFIVLEKADLDKAVKGIMDGRFENAGQVCTSSKRIIVVDSVYEDLVQRLKKAIEDMKVGDPLDQSNDMGPMSSEDQMKTVLDQIEKTKSKGAQLLLGGSRIDTKGFFIEPTLFVDVKKGQPAYDEEIFGPVAAVIKVADDEEAIKVANDSPYGLGGSVFCEDIEHAKQVAARIETGMVFINRHNASVPQLPFGGVKNSGYGRELAWQGLYEFVNQKLVRVSDVEADY